MDRTCMISLSFAASALLATSAFAECAPIERQPATDQLIQLVESDTVLKYDLSQSIALGQRINSDPMTNPVASIEDYYDFVDALVTYNPQNILTGTLNAGTRVAMDGKNYCKWNILDILAYSYFLVDRQLTTDPRGQIQFSNAKFGTWMRDLANQWGDYLETPSSAVHVPDFTNDPNFGTWTSATDPGTSPWYCPPAGGYDTFQDFFTRELCAATFPNGSRPVQGYDDPKTVVAIGDSTSAGHWPISEVGQLVTTYDGVSQAGRAIKGKLYSDVHEFIMGGDETVLETFGSIDPALFNGGTWTHQFLNVNNYHRLHVPVSGKVVYLKHLQAGVRMKSGWVEALSPGEISYYDPQDTADWQFGQTRMVIGIDTGEPYGMVVISPMGMAQVSGIQKRDWVTLGAEALKGQEFANFAFGGSDFVVIFEKKADFVLTVETLAEPQPGAGVNYAGSLQGEKYGCFGGDDSCSATPGGADQPPAITPDQ